MVVVDQFSLLIQFENVGEDCDADLHLGGRLTQLRPIVDPFRRQVAYRPPGKPSSKASEGSGSTMTEMRRHTKNLAPAFPG